ncbi:MAG: hypothetical protein JXR87_04090 [Candidatus Marinimicrobia bacterium]|nr:hypothetical protein [Candidatus Neomarinimicrobiota bacterium]
MNITDRVFIRKLGRLILMLILGIISLFLLLFLFWSVCIGGLFLIIFSVIMLTVFLPIKLNNQQFTIVRIIFGIAAVAMILMFADLPIVEIQKRFNELDSRVASRGPATLTFSNKLCVYNTNLIISFYGRLLGFPEYGKQSLRLCVNNRGARTWDSEFPLKSPKVVGVINNWSVLLKRKRRDITHVILPARTISWQNTQNDRRVALALNPVTIEAKASPVGGRWRMDCRATTRVKYRSGTERILLTAGDKKLILPEGPFWALQQAGWLKPYTAVWEWSVFSDDKRLIQ